MLTSYFNVKWVILYKSTTQLFKIVKLCEAVQPYWPWSDNKYKQQKRCGAECRASAGWAQGLILDMQNPKKQEQREMSNEIIQQNGGKNVGSSSLYLEQKGAVIYSS